MKNETEQRSEDQMVRLLMRERVMILAYARSIVGNAGTVETESWSTIRERLFVKHGVSDAG